MGFIAAGARIWPITPDWSGGVTESLGWGTNVMRANATAITQHEGYQLAPTRSFSFEVAAHVAERRIADMLLAGHRGRWLLPVFPDVQWLTAPLASGAVTVPCETDGFDFVAGGQALLYVSPNEWEVVLVDSVDPDGIGLVNATIADHGRGGRLYPLRSARLRDGAQEQLLSDELSRRRLAFDIAEPCDWPVLADPSLYLTHPVLDVRPDEAENTTAAYARLRQVVAFDGTMPVDYDVADQALRSQATRWKLFGRPEHSWYRSLLYTLQGQLVPLWLPSFAQDLQVVASIAGGSSSLSVEWAGYTQFGKDRHNRRDLRIELVDGTVFYRRITAAVEAGATESLTLSSSLDAGSIAPSAIRQVSFMALAALGSDKVDIEHETDASGIATSSLAWQAVVPDV